MGVRIRRLHLEQRFLARVQEQLLDDRTIRWAEREVAKRLVAPPVDTGAARKELAAVDADLQRVVDAIAKVGLSAALESKLADLEARKRSLIVELQAAGKTIQLPDMSIITAKWRTVVEDLGNLPKLATPTEVGTARQTLQALLGIVRVDRDGKGYADLGLPTNMVAGASFVCRFRPIELRKDHSQYPKCSKRHGCEQA